MTKKQERREKRERLAKRLYKQAFNLWATLYNHEGEILETPPGPSCEEAWRLRHLTERAFRRMQRRQQKLKDIT